MQNISWAAPILPGKLDARHRFNDEVHGLTPELLEGPPPSEVKLDWQG